MAKYWFGSNWFDNDILLETYCVKKNSCVVGIYLKKNRSSVYITSSIFFLSFTSTIVERIKVKLMLDFIIIVLVAVLISKKIKNK